MHEDAFRFQLFLPERTFLQTQHTCRLYHLIVSQPHRKKVVLIAQPLKSIKKKRIISSNCIPLFPNSEVVSFSINCNNQLFHTISSLLSNKFDILFYICLITIFVCVQIVFNGFVQPLIVEHFFNSVCDIFCIHINNQSLFFRNDLINNSVIISRNDRNAQYLRFIQNYRFFLRT